MTIKTIRSFLENHVNEDKGWQIVREDDLFEEITWQNVLRDQDGNLWVVLIRDRLHLITGEDGQPVGADWMMDDLYVYPSSEAEAVPMHSRKCRVSQAIRIIYDNHLETDETYYYDDEED